jgi:hypothetical protein
LLAGRYDHSKYHEKLKTIQMIALRSFFSAFLFLFSLSLLFTACEKNNVSPVTNDGNVTNTGGTTNVFTNGNENGANGDCFTIVYPLTLNFSDGTTATVNSDDELDLVIDTWFEAQGEEAEEPVPTFPVAIILENGTDQMLQDMDDLDALIEACYGDEDDDEDDDDDYEEYDEECFTIIYPIELNFPDGNTATINDDEELEDTIDNWFEVQGEEAEEPVPTFPITIVWEEDGEEEVLNNIEELEEAFEECEDHEDCYEDEEDYEECFTFNFPIDFTSEDGTTTTINSEEELEEFLDMADEDELDLEVVYPIIVTLTEDGSQVDVNDDDELEELYDSCD